MTILSLSNVGVEFGATRIFSGMTFTVAAGERWGIVGRNGTGKTSLFRLLTGELAPSSGEIARAPATRVALLEQHRDFGDATTVWEAAAGELSLLLDLERSLEAQANALATNSSDEALARYGRDMERFEREDGYATTSRIDAVLSGLGFDPHAARSTPVAVLSGGERGRLALAAQLVGKAEVLLLDEPTNHLDLETARWLEDYLHETDRTVLVISHDRAFLAAIADHILHFEGDSAFPYTGSYKSFVEQRELRRLTQLRAFDKQQKSIARESDYIARNIAGQNTAQAKGRRKRLARLPRMSAPIADEESMTLRFGVRERGGDLVVVAEHASISIGDRSLLTDFTGSIRRGDVLGFIGPNGAGKSTLLRALLGEGEAATVTGELRLGGSVSTGYYKQDMSQVPLDLSIYDAIAGMRPTWERRLVQGHLGRFGFTGDEVKRKAGTLSGGERARVALAMLMLTGANLLVLDEPTNHLDVESIESLEDAVERYDGTVLLVSHDRELLRALTTRLWVLHDGRITEFDGGFGEWEEVSAERRHAAAVRAAEEESLRKLHERKRLASKDDHAAGKSRGGRLDRRDLEREIANLEEQINSLEVEAQELTKQLEDPALYIRDDGVSVARQLGVDLERVKSELDAALASWEHSTELLNRG